MLRLLGLSLLASLVAPALAAPAAIARPEPAAEGQAPCGGRQRLLDEDPRLRKPVTVRLKRSPLATIVAELARQSEVPMRASADVADEPALLFVTDQPVKEVMHQLATLFGYRWMRNGRSSDYTYELYQDLRSKQDEEARRQGRYARALASLQAALRDQMCLAQRPPELLLREAAALDHEQATRGPTGRPAQAQASRDVTRTSAVAGGVGSYRLRELADPGHRALLQVASLLSPDQWQALLRGETVHFSTLAEPAAVPLPPALTPVLRAARPSSLPPGVRPGFALAEDAASYAAAEQRSQEAWQRARGFCISARLRLTSTGTRSEAILTLTPTAVMPPEDPEEPTLLPSLITVGHGAVTPDTLEPSDTPQAWREDPVLSRKRRLPPGPSAAGESSAADGSFDDLLAAIARSYGINLVADGYRTDRSEVASLPVAGERSLYEVLEESVRPLAGWMRAGAFFRVRRHGWYHLRQREIPERVAQMWTALLIETDRLTLEEAARLALSLRDEQLKQFGPLMREAGVLTELGFDGEGVVAGRQRSVLRAYGSLAEGQRRLLEAGGSVSAAAMPLPARRWLQAALAWGGHTPARGTGQGGMLPEGLSLTVTSRAPTGLATEVRFRYETGLGGVEEFRIALPRAFPAARLVPDPRRPQ